MSDPEQEVKNEEINMDFSKKKKKKKSKAVEEEVEQEAEAQAPAEEEPQEGEIDLSKKKKKKKSKKVAEEEEPAPEEAPEAEEEVVEEKPKKKKKKKPVQEEEEQVEEAEENVEELVEELKKKKPRKKPVAEEEPQTASTYWSAATVNAEGEEEKPRLSISREGDFGPEHWVKSDRDYKYAELLDRIFTMLKKKNPELGSGKKKRIKMKPPQVARDGPKKTVFINFEEICTNLHRQSDHVLHYLLSELGTTGSVDGSNRLVIRGVFQGKHIESVLRKYISEYVVCSVCGSVDTLLTRDPNTRLYALNCQSCNASKTVQAVKQGFVANFTPRRNRG